MRTSLAVLAMLAVALLLAANSTFAGVISPLNGSFENPAAAPDNSSAPVDNWDVNSTIPIPPEGFYNTWGHSRWGGASSPYAAGQDGHYLLALECSNDYAGYMGVQQDLGTMVAGETYAFSGTMFGHQDWPATYEIIFYNVNDASTLGSISDLDFPVAMKGNAGEVATATMDYTAGTSDDGDELRLLLLPRNLGPGTHARAGIDMVSVSVNPVPEPSTCVMLVIGLLSLVCLPRRRG